MIAPKFPKMPFVVQYHYEFMETTNPDPRTKYYVRKAALAAAVTLALVRLYWFVSQVRAVATVKDDQWVAAAQLGGNFLFLIPFPVLLFAIHLRDTRISVQLKLRYLAVATALAGGLLAVPQVSRLADLLHESPDLNWFGGTSVAMQLWGLFRTRWFGYLAHGALQLASELALFVFLMILSAQNEDSKASPVGASLVVRRIAMVSLFTGVLSAILSSGQLVHAAVFVGDKTHPGSWISGETRLHFVLQNALFPLPQICWAVTTWIVFKCLVRSPGKVTPEL